MQRFKLIITPKMQEGGYLPQIIAALREHADLLESGKHGEMIPHGRMDAGTCDVEWEAIRDMASGPMETEQAAPEPNFISEK